MRLTLKTKISASILGVAVLAVASSATALLSNWQVRSMLAEALSQNAFVIDAEEMEVAMLEQRGLATFYVTSEGDRIWLEKLATWQKEFETALAKVRAAAHTAEETRLLDDLEAVYRDLDAKRADAISRYQKGGAAAVKQSLLDDVNTRLYDQAYDICEDFIDTNQRHAEALAKAAESGTALAAWVVAASVLLTLILGGALLALFFRGVLGPLKTLAGEARLVAGDRPARLAEKDADDLSAVGSYLRLLMSDVRDTRVTLQQSRNRLASAEKLASLGKLAAGVAHEIRNPLTSMRMWWYAIRKAVGGDVELDRKFAIVAEEMDRLESIVRNFLEFSRPPALKPVPQSIATLIGKTLELVGPQIEDCTIRVECDIPAGLPEITVDSEQIKQVLINLLHNAAEVMEQGGKIRITAASQWDFDKRLMLVVRIADTGPGMSDDVKRHIFEPFFSTKENGTGLGLAISAQILARHDGRLVLESSSEQGTTFAVWIPILS